MNFLIVGSLLKQTRPFFQHAKPSGFLIFLIKFKIPLVSSSFNLLFAILVILQLKKKYNKFEHYFVNP